MIGEHLAQYNKWSSLCNVIPGLRPSLGEPLNTQYLPLGSGLYQTDVRIFFQNYEGDEGGKK